ncbi:TPA: acyltransferase family protein [Candidatus Ventrenecus avicola]|nr:acyltransferase family protein [Candidatus Ventrenecus avicola]
MKKTITNKRLDYIDWAKALSIFFIVIAHFLKEEHILRIMLYSFHVPIFFLISGILFKQNSFTKLFKRIIIPYIFYYLVSSILVIILDNKPVSILLDIFYFDGKLDLWNSVLWFLPCYYIVMNLMSILLRLFKDKIWVTLIVSIIISIFFFYNDTLRYFGLNKCILLYNYCCLGYLLKNVFTKVSLHKNNKTAIISFILFILTLIVYGTINQGNPISINGNDINNIIVYILFSAAECILFLLALSCTKENRLIKIISNNTLFIMCTHLFFRICLRKILNVSSLIYQLSGIFVFIFEILIVLCIAKCFKSNKINLKFLGLNIDKERDMAI